jgi:5'-nucleotidase
MRRVLFRLSAVLVVLALGVGAAGCSSDDDSDDTSTDDSTDGEATTDDSAGDGSDDEAEAEIVRVLVSDDDGIDGLGLIALVEALAEVPDTELTISAPAENQSGSSDTTTPGAVADLTTTETDVAGVPATAVDGYPADAVLHAIEVAPEGAESFDVVISGVNEGQNIGSIEQLSGTVGAARTGARAGLPALAVSSGLTDDAEPSFELASDLAVQWLEDNRELILSDDAEPGPLFNLNVPSCPDGTTQDLLVLEEGGIDVAGRDTINIDCTVGGDPTDEVDAFIRGYPVLVPLPVD